MADAYDVTVTVYRATTTTDDTGGQTDTWAAVAGMSALAARLHRYQRTSEEHLQAMRGGQGGPGLQTKELRFFRFTQPAPAIEVADRLKVAGGDTWTVLYVRPYSRTLQVDCELYK